MDPDNRRQDQEVPKRKVVYGSALSYRIIFDRDTVEAHKRQVRGNLEKAKLEEELW